MKSSLFSLSLLCAFLHFGSARPADRIENYLKNHFNQTLEDGGVHWAVLVAGSYSWANYRHQADICHAYQIVKKNGIPDERIIVMMMDDIAGHPANPTPGKIINHPNGPDVYEGVPRDYTGSEMVTPEVFMKVLKGDERDMKKHDASGKVLKSGPNDHVFINFVDHGAPGLIAFPHKRMYARDLIKTLKYMNENNMYKKLVFYLEACESGSMFDGQLTDDMHIFATTAANPKESSYSCYYDKHRRTFLGDLYSVNWMENSDASNIAVETLEQQFELVRQETNKSHVMEYGDMSIKDEDLSEYQGGVNRKYVEPLLVKPYPKEAVASGDVPLVILQRSLADSEDKAERQLLLQQINELEQLRGEVRATFRHIASLSSVDDAQTDRIINHRHSLVQHDCYISLVEQFHSKCFNLNEVDYALRHLYVLVNICEEGIDTSYVNAVIDKICY